jgi:hypothetical protein
MWKAHPEDLGQGIHPFCVSETSPDAIAELQELARKYNLITSDGASPSLTDARELVGGNKAAIPRNLITFYAQNQLFLVLLRVFLGAAHLVTAAWELHTVATQQQLLNLKLYVPWTARHQLLLPALIQRWCQLHFSYWLELQWNGMNDVAEPNWSELWMHVTLKTDWESPLPERYLAPLAATIPGGFAAGGSSQMSGLTGTTSSTGSTAPAPAPAPSSQSLLEGVVAKCVPYLEVYSPFRATGKCVREVIKSAALAGHVLPTNDRRGNMCISYHVKGVCNTNCGRNSDPAPHSSAETIRLVVWCKAAFAT